MKKINEEAGLSTEKTANPELAETLAYSTKTLRDAASELRKKARQRIHTGEAMDIGGGRVSYKYVADAYEKKSEILDKLADSLEVDAAATLKLVEQEPDSVKKRLLVDYELFKARFISNLYASFNTLDELTPKDLQYKKLQREFAKSLAVGERQRQEKYIPPIPHPPKFIMRMMGFTEEEIENQ